MNLCFEWAAKRCLGNSTLERSKKKMFYSVILFSSIYLIIYAHFKKLLRSFSFGIEVSVMVLRTENEDHKKERE